MSYVLWTPFRNSFINILHELRLYSDDLLHTNIVISKYRVLIQLLYITFWTPTYSLYLYAFVHNE